MFDVNNVGYSHFPIDFRVMTVGGRYQEVVHIHFATIG